jgi:hypothetical protein
MRAIIDYGGPIEAGGVRYSDIMDRPKEQLKVLTDFELDVNSYLESEDRKQNLVVSQMYSSRLVETENKLTPP